VLAVVAAVVLRRSAVIAAAVVVGVTFAALSLGAEVTVAGDATGVPGPWALVGALPVLDHIPASRLSMVCIPVFGLLVAALIARVRHSPRWLRAAVAVAVAVALVPWLPASRPVVDRAAVPEFFTSGDWARSLDRGDTVVPVPVPSPQDVDAYRWQTAVGFDLVLPGGYFLYPGVDGAGHWGAAVRPTDALLQRVQAGARVRVTAADRAAARRDLAHWQADAVVLPVSEPRAAELATTVTELLGRSPTRIDDVLLWHVPTQGSPGPG
jgi:dolichyl-phosphate beta-glucosyltransferase